MVNGVDTTPLLWTERIDFSEETYTSPYITHFPRTTFYVSFQIYVKSMVYYKTYTTGKI